MIRKFESENIIEIKQPRNTIKDKTLLIPLKSFSSLMVGKEIPDTDEMNEKGSGSVKNSFSKFGVEIIMKL